MAGVEAACTRRRMLSISGFLRNTQKPERFRVTDKVPRVMMMMMDTKGAAGSAYKNSDSYDGGSSQFFQ